MAAGSKSEENGDGGVLPLFDVVNADAEESEAASGEMRRLYHELGYLDRGCMLPPRPRTEGGNGLARLAKRCIGKICGFLVYPILEEQTRINVQQANYLREMVHQMNRLTEENIRLRQELEEMKEKLLS